jgi:GNAT superfamily N-acetyltransferase
LTKETVKAFVAIENEKMLGYVLMFVNSFMENPFQYKREFIILDQILVLENARSKGIGKLLLDEVFTFAKSLNINVVELNHWTLNESARLFFNKNGFK